MGRITTPAYRIEFTTVAASGRRNDRQAWRKEYGRPTNAQLERWVYAFEDSTLPGYVNDHLGVTRVTEARIVQQSTSATVATYTAAAFAVRDMKRHPIQAARKPTRQNPARERGPLDYREHGLFVWRGDGRYSWADRLEGKTYSRVTVAERQALARNARGEHGGMIVVRPRALISR